MTIDVLIIGAAGMLGRKLVERISRDGAIGDTPVGYLALVDVVEPARPVGFAGMSSSYALDIVDPSILSRTDNSTSGCNFSPCRDRFR